ncbi:MAG: hypothetical protein V4685_08245 [Bacteroidota bacterium]
MTKIKNIAVALSAIVLFAGNSVAGTVNNSVSGIYYPADEPMAELLTVNYLGEDADYLIFEVSVKAGSNKTVSFAVNDREDGELYSTTFRADKKQTFKIEKRFNQQLDFSIRAGKNSYSRSFTVVPTVTLEVESK